MSVGAHLEALHLRRVADHEADAVAVVHVPALINERAESWGKHKTCSLDLLSQQPLTKCVSCRCYPFPIGLNLSIADLSFVAQASGHSAGRQGSRRMHWRGMIRGNAACCDLKHIPISLWLAARCSPCLRASVACSGWAGWMMGRISRGRSKWGQVESSCIFQRGVARQHSSHTSGQK